MIQSYILTDAFKQPVFPAQAAIRHAAPEQRRLHAAPLLARGRAGRFRDELSLTDQRFFETVAERKAYEQRFADWIERSLIWTDGLLGELLELVDDDTILLVGTALGQKPHDPVHEIHNPVVRLVRERELFAALGFRGVKVLTQMNPDVSLSLPDEATAERAADVLRGLYVHPGKPLFEVERRGRQVFLELLMPRRRKGETLPPIRHTAIARLPGAVRAPRARAPDQRPVDGAARRARLPAGLLRGSRRSRWCDPRLLVTDIAPTILSWFGIAPQPWMTRRGQARDQRPLSHAAPGRAISGRRASPARCCLP